MKQKFQIGERVRVTNALNTQFWAKGVEFTIDQYIPDELFSHSSGWYKGSNAVQDGETFQYPHGDAGNSGGIWEGNLERVKPTLEEKLAKAKAVVAELEKAIEDAKPHARDIAVGTHVVNNYHGYGDDEDSTYSDEYVKVGKNSWALVSREVEYFNEIHVHRDVDIDRHDFEVKVNK